MADVNQDGVDSFMARYGAQAQPNASPVAPTPETEQTTPQSDGVENFISRYGSDALVSDREPDDKLEKARFHIPVLDQADTWRDNVFRAFGAGATPGLEAPVGSWSEEFAKFAKDIGIYDDTKSAQETIMSRFNRQVLGPPASAIINRAQATFNVVSAGLEGTAAAAGVGIGTIAGGIANLVGVKDQYFGAKLGREFGGMVETGGGLAGSPGAISIPHAPEITTVPKFDGKLPAPIVAARDLGVIGPEGEAAYYGHQSAPVRAETDQIIRDNTPSAPAQPDIGSIARQSNPDLFNEWDSLVSQQATFKQWIDDLQAQRAAGTSPEVAALDSQIQDLRSRQLQTQGAERRDIANQVISLEARREQLLPTTGDTPEIAKIRQELMKAEFRMRDLSPQVSSAYRDAQTQAATASVEPPEETAISSLPNDVFNGDVLSSLERIFYSDSYNGESVPLVNYGMRPEEISALEKAGLATNGRMSYEQYTALSEERSRRLAPKPKVSAPISIREKVSKQLVSAGRPQEEADAAGAVAQAYWETRAARFQGKKGTADEMFAREGATYQAEGAPEPEGALEFAQPTFTREQAQAEIQDAIDADYERRMQSVRLRFRAGTADYDLASAMARRNAEDWINQPEGREYLAQSQFAKDHPDYAATLRDYLANNYEAIAEGQPFHANVNRIGEVIYNQARRGKIAISEGRKTVTLMKTADASTFIHESGHEYLENLMADAVDRDAPDQLRADAQTVRDYLGNDGGRLTKAQHEKFARGFERYLMEGVAPSRGLARVFAQFKNWLTAIYRTVSHLRSPITDDIRAVFDRLLAETPERTVIAPEAQTATIAETAEEAADNAAKMPPILAANEADRIRQQADELLAANAPEIADELGLGTAEARAGAAESNVSDRGGNAGQPESTGAPSGAAGGTVGARGGEAETAGAGGTGAGGPPRGGAGTTGGETGKPDEPTSYRIFYKNLNTSDDANNFLQQIGRDNGWFSGARGKLSDGQRNELATELAVDPAAVTNDMVQRATDLSGAPLEAHIWAARNIIPLMVQDVWDTMEVAAHDNSTILDTVAYVKAQERLLTMMNAILTVRAHLGRSMRAFHRISDVDAFRKAQDVTEFFQGTTGKTPEELRIQAKLGLRLKTQSQRANYARRMSIPTRWEVFKQRSYIYVMNALLSNPATHFMYAVGNRLYQEHLTLLKLPAAAGIRRLTEMTTGVEQPGYTLDWVSHARFALGQGGRYGLIAAKKAFESGVPVLQGLEELKKFYPEAAENPELLPLYFHQLTREWPGAVGKALTYPQKSIAYIHTLGYSQAFEVAATMRAMEKASDEGLRGEEMWARASEIRMNGLTEEDLLNAHKEGLRAVLMRRPQYGTSQYYLTRVTATNFAARMMVPFSQIWANKMDIGLQNDPLLGLARKETRADLRGENGIYKKQMAQAAIGVGAGVIAGMVTLRAMNLMTGPGPADPREQAKLRQTGWQPFSFHINGGFYPMAKFGPLAIPFQVAAAYYDFGIALAHTGEGIVDFNSDEFNKGISEAANVFAATFEHVALDDFWLRGVADFYENWEKGGESIGQNVANTAFSYLTPYSSGLRFLAEITDKYKREARTPAEAFMRNLPIASRFLYAQRDLFGVPVPSSTSVTGTREKTGPVWAALERVNAATGYWPPWPSRDSGGAQLTEKGYDDYCRIAGQNAYQLLSNLIRPGFEKLPMDEQEKAIKQQFKIAREQAARTRVLMQDFAEAKALKRQSLIENATQTKRAAIVGGPQFSPWSQ